MLAILAAEGGAETEKVINPILPTGNELIWGAVTFFLLYALMKWVLLPPVVRVMNEREARLNADRQAAEVASDNAAQARSVYDERIAAARDEANAIVAEAREEAEAYRATKLGEVNAEVGGLREQAATDIAAAKSTAMGRLEGDVAKVAVAAASKVMQRPIDLAKESAAVQEFVTAARGSAK